MTARYSTPPTAESLAASTEQLTKALDQMEHGTPLVTDQQRLEVCRELVAYQFKHGQTHLDQAMYAYEREVKARMGR